jgi:pyroglutamyl-peptidase
MPRVLLTSFEPFGGHGLNSSLEVGRAIAERASNGVDLSWVTLPVVVWECVERTWAHVERFEPDIVIALGQAAGATAVRLEDRAINIHHFSIPDNAGNLLQNEWIVPAGPWFYQATAPLTLIEAELRTGRVPVERSFHAGTYVCNHLFYGLLHRAEQEGLGHQTAFIHLPLLPQQVRRGEKWPARPVEVLVEGVRRAIATCVESVREKCATSELSSC